MRNAIMHAEDPLRECLDEAYSTPKVLNVENHIPNDPALPLLLDKVYTCIDVVKIDYQIPGCPPSGETLWTALTALINNEAPAFDYAIIKYD